MAVELNAAGCRLLVLRLLADSVTAARRGNVEMRAWCNGPEAARWAGLADVSPWPPKL